MSDLPTLLPTDTPAEIIANRNGNTLLRDAATVAARAKLAKITDIALAVVQSEAQAGNVACCEAIVEIERVTRS